MLTKNVLQPYLTKEVDVYQCTLKKLGIFKEEK